MKQLPEKPMMSDEEIKIIDDYLTEHRPKHCLEWGSGASTVYFPKNNPVDSWLSVEHNGHYLDAIQNKCDPSVQTLWILPGASYSDCVQRSNRMFDFIFIDGLDRAKCLENSFPILNLGGAIFLHDAGRKEYKEIIQEYRGEMLTEGEIPLDGSYAHRGLAVFYGTS